MGINTTEAALREDLRLGLTPEVLLEEYIHKNKSLQELADEFSVGIKKIRGALRRAGIEKSFEQFHAKTAESNRIRSEIFGSNFQSLTLEERRANQLKGVAARKANRLKKLQEKGFTEEYLRRLYIQENRSLKELQSMLDLSKSDLRSILSLYGIVKTQEDRDRARSSNLTLFYEDPDKVNSMVLKRHETVRELYGRSWYRKTTSREEDALRDILIERHPELELIQSNWSSIRRESNGAQLQLDFLFPELGLAIEYNGEYYHDRERYEASLRGECYSPELEKSLLCEAVGMVLIHVWSSDWKADPEGLLDQIATAVEGLRR